MEENTDYQNIITKAATTETGKTIAKFLFGHIEDIASSFNADRAVQAALVSISAESESKEKILERIQDKYMRARTLSSPEKNQDISDIYHPLSIEYSEASQERIEVVSHDTFINPGKTLCIIGKAGQGKTTLLKRLFLTSLEIGSFFPIFISLRNIDWDNISSADQLASEELMSLGFNLNNETTSFLLQSAKAIIFWDGFDEIPNSYRAKAARIIDQTYITFNCPSFVTTRPDTEITRYGGSISNVRVLDLKLADIEAIINKTVNNEESYRDSLCQAVRDHESIKETLVSPILVDIFIYTYRSLKTDPTSIKDFYSELFLCIARQHDKMKLFEREHFSGLSVHQLLDVFRYASYRLLNTEKVTFKEDLLCDYFSTACEKLNYKNHNNLSHLDVINLTNLIKPDGHGEYSYIHKSIMEFYAAECIKGSLEDVKLKFYSTLMNYEFSQFNNTLSFLYDIDKSFFLKSFAKPIIDATDKCIKTEQPNLEYSVNVIPTITGVNKITFIIEDFDIVGISTDNLSYTSPISKLIQVLYPDCITKCSMFYFKIMDYPDLLDQLISSDISCEKKKSKDDGSQYHYIYDINLVIEFLCKEFDKEHTGICDLIVNLILELISEINDNDQSDIGREDLLDIL